VKDVADLELNDFLVGPAAVVDLPEAVGDYQIYTPEMIEERVEVREFSVWAKEKKIEWIGADCGSADHPINTIIRDWMPRQAAEADEVFQEMYGTTLADRFTPDKYQLMHIEMFPDHIIHAECLGGEIDLLVNRRTTVGFFHWRFVDGESSIPLPARAPQ
jgi:kynurenine formamidase